MPLQAFAESSFRVPPPSGPIYVQDFANVLDSQQKNELIELGYQLEKTNSIQLALVTVEDLQGQDMAQYANTAFRQYGIGQKDSNNGILLIFAPNEKEIRIEVGYGLEGVITDMKSGKILDESAMPLLKENKYDQALVNTYKSLYEVLSNEDGAPPSKEKESFSWLKILGIGAIILLIILDLTFGNGTLTYFLLNILSAVLRNNGNGRGGGNGGGGSSGGGGAGRGF